jgi:hypothetical protein
MTGDVSARAGRFREELERDRDYYLHLGRWNYRAAYGLTIVTVLSSAAAGILGLGFEVDDRIVALLALIPAIAVSVSSQFKWQDKANWHYRKHQAAKAQLRRLDYDLPTNTAAQLAELAQGYSVIEAELTASWEDNLKFEVEAEEAMEEAAGEEADGDEGELGSR